MSVRSLSFLFSLSIPRPPTSTLFPYTTLFRSERSGVRCRRASTILRRVSEPFLFHRRRNPEAVAGRSEEHTSELQSRVDLVCRLLLEKKKPRGLSAW